MLSVFPRWLPEPFRDITFHQCKGEMLQDFPRHSPDPVRDITFHQGKGEMLQDFPRHSLGDPFRDHPLEQ
jgi:hypothetical protein